MSFLGLNFFKNSMEIKEFNIYELDSLGIHWMQYLSMTLISLLIFSFI